MARPTGMAHATSTDALLERLYREYWTSLCGYIRRRFGSGPPDPDDIAQEAFSRLAAQQEPSRLANPKAYLMISARNIAIDARRKSVGANIVMQSVAIMEEDHREPDACDALCSRKELERLAAIVDLLTPKQRAAFLLHRVDGLSFTEIALRLRVSRSGARMLVNAAMDICVKRMTL